MPEDKALAVEETTTKIGILGASKEVLLGVAFLSTVFHAGLIFGVTAFNSQLVKLSDAYNEDNVASIFTIGHNITAFACFFSGLLLDRVGPRACAVSGLLIEAVGHVILAQAPVDGVAMWTQEVGFAMLGLGGCQVLMAGLCFTEAFEKADLVTSLLSGAYNLGGLAFIVLPVIATTNAAWAAFFYFYAVFAVVLAVLLFFLYPDAALDPYVDSTEETEMCGMATAMKDKTLKEVVFRPGVIWFLITFAVTGSVLVYGDGQFVSAMKVKDTCSPDQLVKGEVIVEGKCDHQALQDLLNNTMMPLISNIIIFGCFAIGWMCDRWGVAIGCFLNVLMVQLFMLSLWLLPLPGQWTTLFLFNFSNAAVYTTQNIYICQEGYNHIGTLYGISNLAMGVGNLLPALYLNTNPFGSGEDKPKTSLMVSSILWLVLMCPLYVWAVIEVARRRAEQACLAKLESSSFMTAGTDAPNLEFNKIKPVGALTTGTLAEHTKVTLGQQRIRSIKAAAFPMLRETDADPTALVSADAAAMFQKNQQVLAQQLHSTPHPIVGISAGAQASISWSPVVTVNPVSWNAKVQRMLQAGKDKTFFVLDFDRTMTKCYLENGGRALDSHDILASCPKISWGCKRMMELLMDKYHPIEIDAKMTREEKIPHMVEWYKLVNQLLAAQGLNQNDVEVAVRGCKDFRLRSGVEELFQIAHRNNIPVIVVSAGLGNVIEEVIRQCIRKPSGEVGTSWDNVGVLSNTLLWNPAGQFKGHSEPPIHMFNKSLQDAPQHVEDLIQGRHVGVLCGDGLGDLTMADGHQTTTVLKVGFLNEKIEDRLVQYCSDGAYDRVVLNDGTYEPVLEMLRHF